jgi:hypothetical protein
MRYRDDLRRRSLTAKGHDAVFIASLVVGLFAPPAVLVVFASDRFTQMHMVLGMIALGAAGFVLAFAVPMVVARRAYRRRVRELEAIGHGFDAAAYLERLGDNRETSVVVARLGFAKPLEGELVQTIRTWMPAIVRAVVDGNVLVVESGELATTETFEAARSRGGVTPNREFDNRAVDRWLAELVRRVVGPLESREQVRTLEVAIRGEVLPWDANA